MSLDAEFRGDINFGVGEIYTIRKWKLTPDGILRSYTYPYEWNGAINTAICNKFERAHAMLKELDKVHHPAPMKDCTCGFWSYYDPTGQWQSTVGTDTNTVFAFEGIIKSWGKVIAGDRGIRSQHSKIVALCVEFPVAHYSVSPENKRLRASVLRDLIGIGKYPGIDIVAKRIELLDKYPLSIPLESKVDEPDQVDPLQPETD